MRYNCPCRGFKTLDEPFSYDICEVCYWGGVPAKLTPPVIRKCQGYNKLLKVKCFQNAYPRPVLDGGKIKFY
ncbi:CPCC family cysteine-rich protein [Neobacillus sp. NPDC093182]|uniref:CPCC family cysteine-rich protein n=1 Tax=Neobacillus sp. NPDC093182 TaxID=3364297 RepID=UPI0037FA6144